MTSDDSTSHVPSGAWKFDDEVTNVFEDMLKRSIPQYDVMRRLCFDLACKYRQRKTAIVDLGCSRGDGLAQLVDTFGVQNYFVGIDVSEPMLDAARSRFAGMINAGVVQIKNVDLRTDYPQVGASVTLCVLTLQFTPIEHRLKILSNIYEHTNEGGALIIVEKILGASSNLDQTMVDLYYELKHANGYSWDAIQRKRLSLEGVLVPMTAQFNHEMLRMTGFREIDCFWRWLNFAGWIAIK